MDGRPKSLFFLGTLFCTLVIACLAPRQARADSSVRVGGNGSALGTLKLLAKAYRESHPEVTITVVPNLGSSGGLAALKSGALDLAVSARTLKADEEKAGLRGVEFARTPFLFAVHQGVPKTGITSNELVGIYSQDQSAWPDGTRIRLILRPEHDTDSALVRQISPAMAGALQAAHARSGMVIAVTDQESLDDIARLPGALGTATLTELITEQRPMRQLSYNGVPPNLKSLADGSYPLVKRYYLVSSEKTSPPARDFAAFIRSTRARQILQKAGNLTPQ